jgi:carbonic anhydrase
MRKRNGIWIAALAVVLGFATASAGEVVPWLVAPKPAAKPAPKHAVSRAVRTGSAARAHVAAAVPSTPGPAAVWAELVAGNDRFATGKPQPRPLLSQRQTLVGGQHPQAVVLTCSDSRVPPELVFDQSLGDVFVVRSAGQVVDAVATGSIEYAVEHLHVGLIVVLGHEKCGAVTAALSGEPMPTPSLTALMGHIRPGIEKACANASKEERLGCAIEANVDECAAQLVAASPVLRERLEQGTLLVVKALYPLESGRVKELGREGGARVTPIAHLTPAPAAPEAPAPVVTAVPAIAAATASVASIVPAPAPAAPPVVLDAAPPRSLPAVATTATAIAAAASPVAWEGQLRYRYEFRSTLDYRLPGAFKRPATQSLGEAGDASIMRTRFGANLRLAPNVKGFFSMQDARTMGAEGSPRGTIANVDLFLAYVDLDSVGAWPVSVRAGRQVLAYGDGRLVSGADWGNSGWGYDGVRVRYAPKSWQIDAFSTWISEGRVEGQDRLFAGLDTLWHGPRGVDLEAYHFARSFGDTGWVAEGGRKGMLYDGTTGGRVRVVRGRLDAKLESAVQLGHRAGDDVRAWFGVARATLELPGAWKPRAQGEFAIGSGDRDPSDGKYERFDPMYWGFHNFQGALDVVAISNVKDWSGGLALQPRKGWSVTSEFHRFLLIEPRDAWSDAAGTTLRRDPTGAAGVDLGRELDLVAKWEARSRVVVLGGYSRFWRGPFVERTGGGSDIDWGFLQMAVGF